MSEVIKNPGNNGERGLDADDRKALNTQDEKTYVLVSDGKGGFILEKAPMVLGRDVIHPTVRHRRVDKKP